MPGIMLLFRLIITHREPARVMNTSTRVKINASMFQPPSEWKFMCRKNTMWTKICTTMKDRITSAVVVELSNTLPITTQNGITVRITASTKPVTYSFRVTWGPSAS